MKKPVPRDGPAVIDATAGRTRLTTSSREPVAGGSASVGGVDSVGVSARAGAASATGSETCAAGPAVVAAAFAGTRALSRSRYSATIPPATITSKLRKTMWFESCRGDADGVGADGAGPLLGASAGVSTC